MSTSRRRAKQQRGREKIFEKDAITLRIIEGQDGGKKKRKQEYKRKVGWNLKEVERENEVRRKGVSKSFLSEYSPQRMKRNRQRAIRQSHRSQQGVLAASPPHPSKTSQ